ncbi:MAG TPA: response regulator [Pyrinomonadaceae bacterium]
METPDSGRSAVGVRTAVVGPEHVVQNYVLVADDHDDTRFLLKAILERRPGIKVVEASNGEIASALAMSIRIDMVLVDRDLALLDGYSVTKRIREHAFVRNLPIIMMSDSAESSAQARAYEVGCDDFIVKPFPLSLLSTLLQRHLTANEAGNQAQDRNAS